MNEQKEIAEDEAKAQADFDSGAAEPAGKTQPILTPAEPEPVDLPGATAEAPETPEPIAKPKYVRLTEEKFAELEAAASKTAVLEQQISKVFGTVGDMQQIVRNLKTQTPRGQMVEIPKGAFAKTAKDFPELGALLEDDLREALKNVVGTGPASAEIDLTKISAEVERLATEKATKLETEALEDVYPDWRAIVGQVDTTKEQPDPNNLFRKWLATKDQVYQARINGTSSAQVLARAIRTFKTETKPAPTPAKVDPKAQRRAAVIADAVQPRGDGRQPGPRRTEDDEFQAGFATG